MKEGRGSRKERDDDPGKVANFIKCVNAFDFCSLYCLDNLPCIKSTYFLAAQQHQSCQRSLKLLT